MGSKIFILFPILLMSAISFGAKKDVFFENDSKHFVRTTLVPKDRVRLEACTLMNEKTLEAYCEQLADIPAKEFQAMRTCTTAGIIAESIEALYGLGTGVAGVLSSEFGAGVLLVVKAAGIETHAITNMKESIAKKKVFNKKVEKDVDHVLGQKFDLFVSTTKASIQHSFISCDAKGVKITDEVIKTTLTPTQVEFLKEKTKDAGRL